MRKIIAILCVCLLLTGCGKRYLADAEDTPKETGEGYFTLIKEWGDTNVKYEIVYANDTGVKYLIFQSYYKAGITPLYNADGSLQVYEESED